MSVTELSVLLPTRGRTTALQSSLISLVDKAHDVSKLELLLAFDHDDVESIAYFNETIAPELKSKGCRYFCYGFERLGYLRLNEYLNSLAKTAKGRWLMFWGDDAIMISQDWDLRITEHTDFSVLRIPTHNCHPYAIFPIVPREWYEMFGYLSAHQLTDSWVSQVGYLSNIMQNIDVEVIHDRFDLTGNNNDSTYGERPMLEGNVKDPRDFNYIKYRKQRFSDAAKIANYLKEQGKDTSWWDNVLAGTQDAWTKMLSPENDPNKQLSKFK